MPGECLFIRVGKVSDDLIGRSVDYLSGDQPRLYRVGPYGPQHEADKDDDLPAEKQKQGPLDTQNGNLDHNRNPSILF